MKAIEEALEFYLGCGEFNKLEKEEKTAVAALSVMKWLSKSTPHDSGAKIWHREIMNKFNSLKKEP